MKHSNILHMFQASIAIILDLQVFRLKELWYPIIFGDMF